MGIALTIVIGVILATYACFVIASDEDDKNGNS